MVKILIACMICLMACSPTSLKHYKYQNEQFPLIDYTGDTHRYRENFKDFIFPTHKKELTQYCSVHKYWENVRTVWSKDRVTGEYRWIYQVNKAKKQ